MKYTIKDMRREACHMMVTLLMFWALPLCQLLLLLLLLLPF